MPRPITFIKAFKHYLLLELELTVEIYSNNGFILLLRKQAQQYWISFQSVISWLSGVTSSKFFIPLEDSAVSTGLVLQWETWSCDTPVCQHYAFLSSTTCFGPGQMHIHCCLRLFLLCSQATLKYLCSVVCWVLKRPVGINCRRIALVYF